MDHLWVPISSILISAIYLGYLSRSACGVRSRLIIGYGERRAKLAASPSEPIRCLPSRNVYCAAHTAGLALISFRSRSNLALISGDLAPI